MTSIIGSPIPARRALTIESYPTTRGEVFDAAVDEAFATNPQAALENLQLQSEEFAAPRPYNRFEAATGIVRPQRERPKELLSADEANSLYGDKGLKFDAPVSAGYAKTLAEKKDAEFERNKIFARAPDGALTTATAFAGSFAGSAADPINIGAAFIPIVGEARYASMIAKLGPRGARFAKGAIEGAIGTAAIEPLVYAGAQVPQYDYTGADSLLNIAIGTGLGGGLHFAGGEMADAWRGRKVQALAETGDVPAPMNIAEAVDNLAPEQRADVLRTAIGQLAKGEEIDVAPIIKRAEEINTTKQMRMTTHLARKETLDRVDTALSDLIEQNPGYKAWRKQADTIKEQGAAAESSQGDRKSRYEKKEKKPAEQAKLYREGFEDALLDAPDRRSTLNDFYIQGAKAGGEYRRKNPQPSLGDKPIKIYARTTSRQQATEYNINPTEAALRSFRRKIEGVRQAGFADIGKPDFVTPKDPFVNEADNIIARTSAMPDDLETSLKELDDLVAIERKAGTLTEAEIAALDAAGELGKQADTAGRALLAAATCIFRKA